LSSHAVALKVGSETVGGCRNLIVSNCSISAPRFTKSMRSDHPHGRAGIELLALDGAVMDGVLINNITIRGGITTPIHLRLQDRGRKAAPRSPRLPVGALRNVVLSNIVATGGGSRGCPIVGLPGHPIENVTLSNVYLEFEGAAAAADAARIVPELQRNTHYGTDALGTLPVYGLFARHVRGLRLLDVQLVTRQPDPRPAVVFDDAVDVWPRDVPR
jgi:hypothetical protein